MPRDIHRGDPVPRQVPRDGVLVPSDQLQQSDLLAYSLTLLIRRPRQQLMRPRFLFSRRLQEQLLIGFPLHLPVCRLGEARPWPPPPSPDALAGRRRLSDT
mmetsp:Transcript_24551/g.80170  ORF Transcript_24551/g.80170 Transcript_24551/m.80170 type:complete len:101 (+) Transcript_24551:3522-3824(+)